MNRLAVLCVLAVTPLAAAQNKPHWDQLDRLARRIEREARDLREEVLIHFKGKPGCRDMEGHVRDIEREANRITKLTDRDARPRLIRESLDKIDEEVRQMNRHIIDLGLVGGIDRKAFDHLRDEFTDISRLLYRMRREL